MIYCTHHVTKTTIDLSGPPQIKKLTSAPTLTTLVRLTNRSEFNTVSYLSPLTYQPCQGPTSHSITPLSVPALHPVPSHPPRASHARATHASHRRAVQTQPPPPHAVPQTTPDIAFQTLEQDALGRTMYTRGNIAGHRDGSRHRLLPDPSPLGVLGVVGFGRPVSCGWIWWGGFWKRGLVESGGGAGTRALGLRVGVGV
ncbi:hypothetical protein K505DRAFT_104898 [Melanomma pulvis-pyrius CBS 109.77]|uniref:Uncharacterized protein n=1 Tax=Melanomma pulvis-pyrius CBS 109.77 TaxID=1314802 RepID=A0A6A6XR78_9PLEO|nr:hypothetical protein K505DRAFT_104898 [Melanomma pulvis-pyrius CBS 109.77]